MAAINIVYIRESHFFFLRFYPIISNILAKYWKLAKHKVAQVRAAWFKVLTEICQKVHFLLDGKGAQVTSTVFNNLEETDPIVLLYVWESALLVMSSIKVNISYFNARHL